MPEEQKDEMNVAGILNSVHIALDDYNDIFSDFDPSPYNVRLLSDDFVKEMQRRYMETKKGDFELRFTLPAAKRDSKIENLIKRRLNEYFTERIDDVNEDIERLKRKGIQHFSVGLLALTSELFFYETTDWVFKFIGLLLLPAGWYGTYSGFEYLFDYPTEPMSRRKFYERFKRAKYTFISEEELLQKVEEAVEAKSAEIPSKLPKLPEIEIKQK